MKRSISRTFKHILRRNYKLFIICLLIIAFNALFIAQTAFEKQPESEIEYDDDNAVNDDETLSCHLSNDLRNYLNKTLNNGNNGTKHEKCTVEDWVLVDEAGLCVLNYEYLNKNELVVDKCTCLPIVENAKKFDSTYRVDEEHEYEIKNGTQLDENYEFFLISCKAYKKNRLRLIPFKYKTAYARILKRKIVNENKDDPINVLFLGFDSISKLGWLENLPKSSKFLLDTLETNILNAYNIVGDGTPAAIIALLTGKYEHELPNTLIGTGNAEYVDNAYPFIWKNYSNELNYATLYAEDWPEIAVFNYRMIGMEKRPTTHYMRQFHLALKNEGMLKESSTLCLHGRTRLQVMLDYTRDFMMQYSQHGFLGISFLSDYSHDQSNHVKWIDDILLKFLKNFHDAGLYKNTILALFSDHGPRFSHIRSTMKGLLEERNPFFSVYLPKTFQTRFPQQSSNFKDNTNRLVTPFDVYETLVDLMQLIKNGESKAKQTNSRSMSLFSKIPDTRTCSDAGVESHWCACLKRKKLKIDHNALELSNEFVKFMNERILSKHTDQCSLLKLAKVNKLYLLEASKSLRVNKKNPIKSNHIANESYFYRLIKNIIAPMAKEVKVLTSYEQYQLQIVTEPNSGVYESTISIERSLHDPHEYKINIDQSLISRVNKYGNQSSCIHDQYPDLRKYCFCNEQKSLK